jgi:hypothetical protein
VARVLVAAATGIPPGSYPTLQPGAGSLALAWQAADASLFQYTPLISGKTVVLAMNTDASNPYTVTIESVVDEKNRTGDITTYSLAAITVTTPVVAVFGPFLSPGWAQSGAQLWFRASNAAIKFAVITLP